MSPGEAHDGPEALRLAAFDVVRVRAQNPGPLTLSGTNTWVVGRDPAFVIDPGPDLPEHVDRVVAVVDRLGGLGGIALTHDHVDHGEATVALRRRREAPVAAARGAVDCLLADGVRFGPLSALATPGHAPDHLAYVYRGACFTGDAVLGEGSVFVAPGRGTLAGYLDGLRRLVDRDLEVLCPGHGPPLWDPPSALAAYIAHRAEREDRLVDALVQGRRTVDELLDFAWADVAASLRPAAAITLAAHLDKLDAEGRLPAGVERPDVAGH